MFKTLWDSRSWNGRIARFARSFMKIYFSKWDVLRGQSYEKNVQGSFFTITIWLHRQKNLFWQIQLLKLSLFQERNREGSGSVGFQGIMKWTLQNF